MSSAFILVFLSSALYNKSIDAGVAILNTSGITNQTISACGQNLTLTCTCRKNTSAIVWKNANDIAPIAICTPNHSTLNPAYGGQYSISFDKTRCISYLTVIQVTMEDNGRILVCSDGSHTDSKIIAVRDYNLHLIKDINSGTIIATSGCVSRDTDVSFKWEKIDMCDSIENHFAPKVHFKNTTNCLDGSVCGNDQHIQFIEKVTFSPSDNGKYLLKVIAFYGHDSKALYAMVERNIMLGEKHACDLQDKPLSGYTIYIAAAGCFGLILLLLFIIKRTKLVSNMRKIMSANMREPSTNPRAIGADKKVYLAISTTMIYKEKESNVTEEIN